MAEHAAGAALADDVTLGAVVVLVALHAVVEEHGVPLRPSLVVGPLRAGVQPALLGHPVDQCVTLWGNKHRTAVRIEPMLDARGGVYVSGSEGEADVAFVLHWLLSYTGISS